MGSDDLFNKRREERKIRQINVLKQKSSNWLIVCEGTKTEPNYFKEVINRINKLLDKENQFRVKIVGKGVGTRALLDTTIDIVSNELIPYGNVFVVFDKDDFTKEDFDKTIKICERKGYIPLWSNQAIEFWFLLHFYYIDTKMDRKLYATKINEYLNNKGFKYKYQKNDSNFFNILNKYGSLDMAIKNAYKIFKIHQNELPSDSESCTTVYRFFEEIIKRLNEIDIKLADINL